MARPSKLTAELQSKIFEYIELGISYEDTCIALGIDASTLQIWKVRGKKEKKGKYKEFFKGIRRAETEAKVWRIKKVAEGEKEDPKLALEMLARKYPKEFGRKDTHNVNVQGDIKINFVEGFKDV